MMDSCELTDKELLLWIVTTILHDMEQFKHDPDREKYCIDFDNEYERKKDRYMELTGKIWEA